MCGSGTMLIEAAMIANNIAPGNYRKMYGFMKWKDYDSSLWNEIYNLCDNKYFTRIICMFSHMIFLVDLLIYRKNRRGKR